jgi:cystathionine beta-synthase
MDILRAVGAEVVVTPTDVTPEDPRSYYSVARRLSKELPNAYYPNQYDNLSNTKANYEQTGPEIWEQTAGKITHLVVGVGTGGTISGCAKYLKEKNPNIKVWGIDTYGSVFKKYHETGIFDEKEIYSYLTEGIGEDILPANVDFKLIDHFEKVADKAGMLMTRDLARKEGIFVGNSAGSAVAGLLQMKDQLKESDVVVVIFHDHGSRYIGKIFNDDWMRERGFLDKKGIIAADLIVSKAKEQLIAVGPKDKVADAVHKITTLGISQIPVMDGDQLVGSLSESQLFSRLISNPELKSETVETIMQSAFPIVDSSISLEQLSTYITRENNAVMVKDKSHRLFIITKHDIIHAIAK